MEIVDFRDAYSDFCLGRDERVKVDETSYGWELYIFFGSERGVRVPPPTDFVFLHSYYPPLCLHWKSSRDSLITDLGWVVQAVLL